MSMTLKAIVWALTTTAAVCAPGPTASLDSGIIIGTTTALPSATAVVNKFLGIPFAESPPVRFKPPVLPKPWSIPLNVTQVKRACMQQFGYPENLDNVGMNIYYNPPMPESEDCLYLNVWAPGGTPPGTGWPVMLWFHGGAMKSGSGGQSVYDGTAFASNENIILVTMNYRLNVFGFPQHADEISVKERNLAFLDQRLSLDWVQRNIKAFGGDPEKVTIFGGSAGGQSVDSLLNGYSRGDKIPFRAGIMQSGQWTTSSNGAWPARPIPEAQSDFGKLARNFNCTVGRSLRCLRALPGTEIRNAINRLGLNFAPTIDNHTSFPDHAARRRQGLIPKLPIMIGSNAQEYKLMLQGQNNLTSWIQSLFPGNARMQEKIAEAYPVGPLFPTENDAIVQISSDMNHTCATANYADLSSKAGYPTWWYWYNASFPNLQPYSNSRAFHFSECFQVFGTYATHNASWALNRPVSPQQVILSRYMTNAWASFARNPEGGPGWPKVGEFEEEVAVLGASGTGGAQMVRRDVMAERCKVFASSA